MAPKTQEGQLSEKEKAILGHAWKCFDSEPKIDFNKLAGLAGYGNPKSAQNILAAAKKKLQAIADGNGEEGAASSSKATSTKTSPVKKRVPAAPKGKKRDAEEANGNNEDEVDPRTPKKARKTPAKSATKKGKSVKDEVEVEEDEGVKEEEEVMVEAPKAEEGGDGDDEI
ncbi:hypothetical protein F5B21DRAFT_529352 [Xylaria acuta]|nr:hypothetical protein F5B21DRAFT_529352 [Xylaria acuta]